MHLDRDFVGELTPLQCRNGPIKDQQCTDFYCCVMYLTIIGLVVFLALLSADGVKLTPQEVKETLQETNFGKPLYAIMEAIVPIVVSLALVAAISLLLLVTSLTIPVVAAFVYIPLILLFMLFVGVVFILRYFGISIPYISPQLQEKFAQVKETFTLIVGIGFLIGFFGTACTICLKRTKFSYIQPVLRIARIAFWPNFYMFGFSCFFTILSLSALMANAAILSICLSRKRSLINTNYVSILILIELVWTHGFLQALSDFFFQSIAIHWYYKTRRRFEKEETICDTLILTFKMIFKHIGTIAFGHVLAYIPQTLNTMIGRIQGISPCIYHVVCIWHNFAVRELNKFCYFQTIMQSFPFCVASREMFGLRQRAKKVVPQIYMTGNFYITLAKILSVMIALTVCYFLVANSQLAHIFQDTDSLIGPMIIVFLGGLQIATHFMNCTGLVGDTVVFLYFVDIEIQKKDFGDAEPFTCPNSVRDIVYEVKAGRTYIHD